jgi:hypothetical protein
MPSSAPVSPRARAASAARAASRPRTKSRTHIALIFSSWRSMRPMASCASSTAETFFAARAADNSVALLKLHCDLAKVFSCWLLLGADDAQLR